jgi:hypothetical protein
LGKISGPARADESKRARKAGGYMTDNEPGAEGRIMLKTAFTDLAASTVTTQAPVPMHAPLQPANVEPGDAVAVSVTGVPGA